MILKNKQTFVLTSHSLSDEKDEKLLWRVVDNESVAVVVPAADLTL